MNPIVPKTDWSGNDQTNIEKDSKTKKSLISEHTSTDTSIAKRAVSTTLKPGMPKHSVDKATLSISSSTPPVDAEAMAKTMRSSMSKTSSSKSLFLEDGQVSQAVFERIVPQKILAAINTFKDWRGSSDYFHDFDLSLIDDLIAAFERGEVNSIVGRDGVIYPKIAFSSIFEEHLTKHCEDLEKAQIIASAFDKHFAGANLSSHDKKTFQDKLVKYVDFIGFNQINIQKILKKSPAIQHIVERHPHIWKKSIGPFLAQSSAEMGKLAAEAASGVPEKDRVQALQPVITTTSSGGAHISISNVIKSSLEARGITPVVVNKSDLEAVDKLSRCIGIPRKDLFNKISQQSGQMEYGKKLKILDDHLGRFIPDRKMHNFRQKVGDSKLIVSTSHHPEDVRLVAEKDARICFQICDYGYLPDKFWKISRTISRYDLSGIVLHVPSEKSTLRVKKGHLASPKSAHLGRAPSPKTVRPESPESTTSPDAESWKSTYTHFVRTFRYPVHAAFSHEIEDSGLPKIKADFGFRSSAKLWVMTMGSQGVGGILEKYIDQIIDGVKKDIVHSTATPLDIAILCGANEQMRKDLREYFETKLSEAAHGDPKLLADLRGCLNFHPLAKLPLEKVAQLGKISDAFLSKPGGGTAAEALIGEFPMVIHREERHPWEFGNIDELSEAGAQEIRPGESFYEKAKKAQKIRSPNPLTNPEACVDYALEALWRLEQARGKLAEALPMLAAKQKSSMRKSSESDSPSLSSSSSSPSSSSSSSPSSSPPLEQLSP